MFEEQPEEVNDSSSILMLQMRQMFLNFYLCNYELVEEKTVTESH